MRKRESLFKTLALVSGFLSACSDGKTGSGGASGAEGGSGGTTSSGSGGAAGSSGAAGSAGAATSGTGGAADNHATVGDPPGGLPALHVEGNLIKDPSGRTIILRGSSLIDIGALQKWDTNVGAPGNSPIMNRIDALAKAGVAGHVVRLPVYPRTNFNQQYPYYSPLPFPVGPAAPASAKLAYTVQEMTADDYISIVLKPAVDYATSKGLYVIVDYHQIDDTTGQSGTDANTFWMQMAPAFKDYPSVIYEAFNEPIDVAQSSPTDRWKAFKPIAQGWVDTIRAAAPNNLIIVGSPSWCQTLSPAATDPLTGSNLIYTAHIYPGNWNSFKGQFDAAAAAHPIAVTEWGYVLGSGSDANLVAPSSSWGTDLRTYLDSKGASWTAWVGDDGWTPSLFKSVSAGTLTDFGTLTQSWLLATASSNWVQ